MLQKVALKVEDSEIAFTGPSELMPRPQFSPEKYLSALHTRQMGQTLLATACIPSTQTLLHQKFAQLPDGTICIADTQTSGKGDSLPCRALPINNVKKEARSSFSLSRVKIGVNKLQNKQSDEKTSQAAVLIPGYLQLAASCFRLTSGLKCQV